MEPSPERANTTEETFVDRVRAELDQVHDADDAARLETLERVRRELEAELDSSLENNTSGH